MISVVQSLTQHVGRFWLPEKIKLQSLETNYPDR